MVLDNNQFKCATHECNRFFGNYIGIELVCFFLFLLLVYLFFGAFVYFLYTFELVPFSLIYLLKKGDRIHPLAEDILSLLFGIEDKSHRTQHEPV